MWFTEAVSRAEKVTIFWQVVNILQVLVIAKGWIITTAIIYLSITEYTNKNDQLSLNNQQRMVWLKKHAMNPAQNGLVGLFIYLQKSQ